MTSLNVFNCYMSPKGAKAPLIPNEPSGRSADKNYTLIKKKVSYTNSNLPVFKNFNIFGISVIWRLWFGSCCYVKNQYFSRKRESTELQKK